MTTYGHAASGTVIDDALIDTISAEIDAGYPGWRLTLGRPPLAKGPSRTRTFRIGSALDAALEARAEQDQVTPSEVVREALAEYLVKA
jgi:hypothetical protein